MTPASPASMMPSTDDRRVENNTMRQQYRTLTGTEKAMIDRIKGEGAALLTSIEALPGMFPENAREFALAKTNLEQAVMWAVKGITA